MSGEEQSDADRIKPVQPTIDATDTEKLYYSQFLKAQKMVLNDRPTQPVDAALFFGHSWFDGEKWGVYQLMVDLYKTGMVKYIVLYGSHGQRFGDTIPNVVAPSKDYARDRLVKMGVPDVHIINSELPEPTKNNTPSEGEGFLNTAQEKGWHSLIAIANPHQILRATLGLVTLINKQQRPFDIWSAAPTNTNWDKK